MNITFSRLVLAVSVALCSQISFSQVGIGTTTPNPDAILDVNSTTSGLLLPRLALTATTSPAPLTADVAGMTVYNTATAGDVTPGFYYNDGADWIRLGGGIPVENGLYYDAGSQTNKLGGALIENTIITQGANQMTYNLDSTGDFSIQDNGVTHFQLRDDGVGMFGGDVYFRDENSFGTQLARVLDSGNDGIFDVMRNGNIQHRLHGNSTVIFNEQSRNFDFRIESDTDTEAFKLEGTDGQIKFGNYGGGALTGVATQYLAVDAAGNIIEEPVPAGGAASWELLGNAGTTPATNFLGTTDNQDVVFRANNLERVRVGTSETVFNETSDNNYDFRIESADEANIFTVLSASNHVYVRQPSPFPTIDMFISNGAADIYPVNGYAQGQSNAAIYGQHLSGATGVNMNAGGAFDGTGIGAGFSTQSGWNVGIVATGDQAGVYGSSTSGGLNVQGGYFEESLAGTVYATARVAGFDGTGFFDYGGYFDGGVTGGDYARVGFNDGVTDYKIQGPGSVSTVVKDEQGENRVLFCPEAPEILFQDYGTGELIKGEAYITIDPILTKNIFVDKKHPLKVFIQLEGDCKGVFVTDKTDKGFKVKELQGGNSNVPFSWSFTASRIDRVENGIVKSKHVGVRFPKGQKRIVPTKPKTAKVSKDYAQPVSERRR